MRTGSTRSLADRVSTAAAVLRAVASEVPYAFGCLATLDPASGVITAAFKSHELPIGDEEFSAAEYGGPDVNGFAELAARRVPVGALVLDTDGRPETSRRFREFLAPRFGFVDELRVACRSRGTVWAALALYRDVPGAIFTAGEAQELAAVHEWVADAVRTVLLAAPTPRSGGPAVPAVLVVDGADRLTDRSAAGEAVIEDLGGWDHGSLPASALAVIARARTAGALVESRVLARSGGWLAIRAVPLTTTAEGVPVVLTCEAAPPGSVGRMALAAQGLTARETEVVALVLRGRSTIAIADALHLSAHTVQDHLKSVFQKVGVGSRRELVARFVE